MRPTVIVVCLLAALYPTVACGLPDSIACNCVLCCDSTWASKQDFSAGHYVPHTGSFKVLVVFARLTEDTLVVAIPAVSIGMTAYLTLLQTSSGASFRLIQGYQSAA